MTAASRPKASDKQGICKKLIALLKKRYKALPAPQQRPVLESMMFAVCIEDTTVAQAEAALARLASGFHDLNEIRVSSVTELSAAFAGMERPEWRAAQVRGLLQYVFEKNFAFEFESLRKKTLELAQKQLAKIRDLSNFVRAWTLHEALGSHTVPLDAIGARACVWLGLADAGSNEEQASAALRPVLRKSEAPLFCSLLRALATDPALGRALERAVASPPAEGFDAGTAPARLAELFDSPDSEAPRKRAGKPAARQAAKSGRNKSDGAKSTRPKTRSHSG